MTKNRSIIPAERIEKAIFLIRGQRVMLDADLAGLYGVSTKRLNEQVKRNQDRFPPDFMFRLTAQEKREVVANCDHLSRLRFSPVLPHAFTEHGAIMLAGRFLISIEQEGVCFFEVTNCDLKAKEQNRRNLAFFASLREHILCRKSHQRKSAFSCEKNVHPIDNLPFLIPFRGSIPGITPCALHPTPGYLPL